MLPVIESWGVSIDASSMVLREIAVAPASYRPFSVH
jgi:hypothetical protein